MTRTLNVRVNLDNAAFGDNWEELLAVLMQVVEKSSNGQGTLYDSNGNTVGRWYTEA